jgi:rubrerythrin
MREGDQSKIDLLKQSQSLAEVLELAIQFEQAAAKFYRELIPKVSKSLRWLVESLADEEDEHAQRLDWMRYHPDLQAAIQHKITTPSTNTRFSDAIHTPELQEVVDDQALLQYALGREQLAMEQYGFLAAEIEAGKINDLFKWLAAEELEHKVELEKLYYEIVHHGGV